MTVTEKRSWFEVLYRSLFDDVYAYFSLCFHASAAEELAQNVFENVWAAVGKWDFTPPDSERAWVFRIAVNVKNDALRAKYRQPQTAELSETDQPHAGGLDAPEISVLVRDAFTRLTDADRELLVLKNAGLDSKELSMLLGVTPSAVRTRLSAARGRFRTILVKCGVNPDE
ncbi:MAG: sigma-70 family RNA polymerase sigma factor [Oscillospiraceae bacterium]